jgi:uncharacterized membrane protein
MCPCMCPYMCPYMCPGKRKKAEAADVLLVCSLTIECVLLLQNVFSYYRMCSLTVFSYYAGKRKKAETADLLLVGHSLGAGVLICVLICVFNVSLYVSLMCPQCVLNVSLYVPVCVSLLLANRRV